MRKHRLHKVFEPESVALVGTSDRPLSVGGQLFTKLLDSDFQGALYAVNPAHDAIRGLQCHATIGDIGENVDLVVIAIPAPAIAQVMRECGERGVRAAIIISAGFGEVGAQGQALQNEIVNIARANNITLLGERLVQDGRQRFTHAGIPSFNSPEAGVDAFGYLAAYRRSQNALLQAPPPLSRNTQPDMAGAHRLMKRLITIAGERGVEVMEGDVLAQNSKMLRLCNSLGFHTLHDNQDPEVVIVRRSL